MQYKYQILLSATTGNFNCLQIISNHLRCVPTEKQMVFKCSSEELDNPCPFNHTQLLRHQSLKQDQPDIGWLDNLYLLAVRSSKTKGLLTTLVNGPRTKTGPVHRRPASPWSFTFVSWRWTSFLPCVSRSHTDNFAEVTGPGKLATTALEQPRHFPILIMCRLTRPVSKQQYQHTAVQIFSFLISKSYFQFNLWNFLAKSTFATWRMHRTARHNPSLP